MSRTFEVISPIDGKVLLERAWAGDREIETVLAKASAAKASWRNSSLSEREAVCRAATDYLVSRADALGEELTRQMGRPLRYTPGEISGGFKERAEYMMGIAEQSLQPHQPDQVDGFERFVQREPLGTVLVLAPWNYPYLTAVNAIIPALMAGNVVVLKHAQQTPLVAERLAEAFEHAGAPEGVFQYIHMDHDKVAQVIDDPRIDFVSFTGSVGGGKAVQNAISNRFIATGLELGGKDPAYVRADADLGNAVENLVDGALFNSGQSCCGIERIYVHDTLFDSFVEAYAEMVRGYKLDDPMLADTTLGPMVRTSAATYARQQVEQAVKQGAKALIDEKLFPLSKTGSAYMAPQVLVDVDHTMDVMREESFAPIIGIMSVKNDEEALRLMNDNRYGLTASVWTKDRDAAFGLAQQIETGTCFMNRCDYLDPALAWTGVKDSGRGVTLSKLGYEVLTRPKSFHFRLA